MPCLGHPPNRVRLPADSFGTLLAGLRPLIPPSLLDGPGWERLLGRVGTLPGAATAGNCGFEFRLGEPEPAADFAVPIALGTALESHCIRAGTAAVPGSAEAALARYFGRGGGARSSLVDSTILEYDIAEPGAGTPPGIFLKLRGPSGPGLADASAGEAGLVADLLADASGWSREEGERRAVERAFSALPAKAEVVHAGALPGRAPRAVRLVAKELDAAEAGAVLKRLGQPRPVEAMEAVLADMHDVSRPFWLSFDITTRGVSSRIGLEMSPPTAGRGGYLGTTRTDWLPIVERLETRGWARPEKAQGLRAWPGRVKVYEKQGVFFMYRGINHVKIVIEGDAVSAKAYAGMSYAPARDPVSS